MFKRKNLIGIIILCFIFFLGFGLVVFLKAQYCLPILMYHSISPSATKENRLSVSVESFERQMRFLKDHHYNVMSLEEVVALIRNKKRIPAKTVAITFDDGYRDNYLFAFSILKKYNLPATMFVIIDEIGRSLNDRLSWNEIKLMQESGVISIGSHAIGPEPLVNIKSKKELRRQIFDSKKILENKLDRQIVVFSYPEGRFNQEIKQLVIEAGYEIAVATNPGKKFSNNDVFAMKRLRVSSTSNSLFVFWIETSGFYNFIRENRHK